MRLRICASSAETFPRAFEGTALSFDLKDLADHFDSGASTSGDIRANRYGVDDVESANSLYTEVANEILDILKCKPGTRVLDVGCGTGDILMRLQARGLEVTGLDLSPGMVKIARSNGCRAEVYEGGTFPFANGSFDVVLIYQVLINLPELSIGERLLQEAARVSRDKGTILVGAVPHPVKSKFPTHRSRWWVDLKIALRKLLRGINSIPYYSYPYAFFEKQLDDHRLAALTLVPCGIRRQGWESKYHAILVK